MICLGLYRFRDAQRVTSGKPSTKLYVITFPPFNFVLASTDLVFVLMQFEKPKKKKKRFGIKNASLKSNLSLTV